MSSSAETVLQEVSMRGVFQLILLSSFLQYCLATALSKQLGAGSRKTFREDLEDFKKAVTDGVSLAVNLLSVAQWPVNMAMALMAASMSFFHFIVDLVRPGGMFEDLVGFLRGGNTNMMMASAKN